ncbi:MAG TPA: DHHA1 domain-containing protein [Vicinamibacterales bacterium]
MTDRVYYTDPYATEFDASVVRIESLDGKPAAVLDRTAFYPTSGGQPFDTGALGDARVVDVIDRDDEVVHVLDRPIGEGPVKGRIDWDRRFEHMQQHTGQHVLSAAFDHLLKARTESFHLGSASATIDLSREVSPKEIERAVDEANRIVWEDRPVAIRFMDADEAAKLPLRKEPARGGRLRLIDVEGFDISACGGTHVARTGGIGNIAVAGWEKFRGGTRVEFVCGVRALRAYRALRDSVAATVRLISVLPGELPAAVERMQADAKDSKRRTKDLQLRLAAFEGHALSATAETLGNDRVVLAALDGWDPNGLKTIASAIVERPDHVAVLLGLPAPASIVVMRGSAASTDCSALLRLLTERFGGKGGGRPDLAQGGGLQGNADEILSAARAALK